MTRPARPVHQPHARIPARAGQAALAGQTPGGAEDKKPIRRPGTEASMLPGQAGQQRPGRQLRGLARTSRRAQRAERPTARSVMRSRRAACLPNHTAPSSPAGKPAMAVPIALTAISLLAAAASAAVIGQVSVAICKEGRPYLDQPGNRQPDPVGTPADRSACPALRSASSS